MSMVTPSVQPAAATSSIAVCRRVAFAFERRFQAEDDPVRPDGRRGDERALDRLVRVVPQERPVLERARLAFGRVHDDGCR